jgi:hypothetical protein
MTENKTGNEGKYGSRLLDIIQAWLPVLTVVGAALWGLYTYIASQRQAEALRLAQTRNLEEQRIAQQKDAEQQRLFQIQREANTRRIEAQKPFLTKQLDLYFETAKVVGRLITISRTNEGDEYERLKQRYYALYWSELSMVEHPNVERAMIEFRSAFERYDTSNQKVDAERAAYKLAHAIREAIESAWGSAESLAPAARK